MTLLARCIAHAQAYLTRVSCIMDGSGSASGSDEEAVTLRPKDIVKLKETVQTFQTVLGGISNDRDSPVPGPSGFRERKKG